MYIIIPALICLLGFAAPITAGFAVGGMMASASLADKAVEKQKDLKMDKISKYSNKIRVLASSIASHEHFYTNKGKINNELGKTINNNFKIRKERNEI